MNETIHVIIESIPSQKPSITSIITAILTLVIAFIATIVAIQQYKINKNRLKHELFDRREKIFQETIEFLSIILQKGFTSDNQIQEFYSRVSVGQYLFDQEVQEFLTELRDKALELYFLQIQLYPMDGSQGIPIGNKRSTIAEEKKNLSDWMFKQYKDTTPLFQKYFEIVR